MFAIVPAPRTHSLRQHTVGPTTSPPSSLRGGIRVQGSSNRPPPPPSRQTWRPTSQRECRRHVLPDREGGINIMEVSARYGLLGGVFAQRGHSANHYGVYPGNSPAKHPPTEACMIHLKQHRGCRIQDPGTRGYWRWRTADFSHSARCAPLCGVSCAGIIPFCMAFLNQRCTQTFGFCQLCRILPTRWAPCRLGP